MQDKQNLDFLNDRLNMTRRSFLKSTAAGAAALGAGGLVKTEEAEAFAYEPYPTGRRTEDRGHQLCPQLWLAPHAGGAQEGRRDRAPLHR